MAAASTRPDKQRIGLMIRGANDLASKMDIVARLEHRSNGNTDATRSAKPGRSLLSSSLMGLTNRGRVLQALFDLGPTSRAELARQAGVNKTTISGIVQLLIEQQFLVEGEPLRLADSSGKPARPLWFSPNAQPICSALIMPHSIRACLVTLEGKIYAEHTHSWSAEGKGAAGITEAIIATIDRALAQAPRAPLGIGVAVGGMVDTDRGCIVAMNLLPALDGMMLGDALADRFHLPVLLDHHPRALLVGDRWFGHGRGLRTFAVVYTGEVLGGAFYLDGRLHRGSVGAGGEIGHTFVRVDGDVCRCGRRGCWDTIATLGWLRREAEVVRLPDWEAINSRRLVELAAAGTAGAAPLLDLYARNIAVGIANLQQTLAPNTFILHGDVIGGGTTMTNAIMRHVKQLVPSRPGCQITFAVNLAEDRAAMLGAAGLVLSDQFQFQF
jgi:predicted NBD/HSP70 family sugar kinase